MNPVVCQINLAARPVIVGLVGALLIAASVLVLPFLIGIWLPDIIHAPHKTLAEARSANGFSFRVVQYWNRCDFYNTELHITAADGTSRIEILDGDDRKRGVFLSPSTKTAARPVSR